MNRFVSYFDCFASEPEPEFVAYSADDFQSTVETTNSETIINQTADISVDISADAQDDSSFDGESWSYRNDDVGVGLVMNTEATDWQDMVWVDWD